MTAGLNVGVVVLDPTVSIPNQVQNYGWNQPVGQFQLQNSFSAVSETPCQITSELLNGNGAGYRWRLNTSYTSTIGDLTLESFTEGALPGTVLLTFTEGGPLIFPELQIGNINITDDTISNTATNHNIYLSPNGTGNVVATSAITIPRIIGESAEVPPTLILGDPTVVGTGASGQIRGSEVGGILTITMGTGSLIAGIICRVQLASSMPSTSIGFSIVLYPNNFQAAYSAPTLYAAAVPVSGSSVFLVTAASGAFTPTTTYSWNYQIVGWDNG
jgi:hypothetical protein